MSAHALLHMFKVKGGSLTSEGNCQAARSHNRLNESVLLFCPVKIIILDIQKLCRQQWKVEEEPPCPGDISAAPDIIPVQNNMMCHKE